MTCPIFNFLAFSSVLDGRTKLKFEPWLFSWDVAYFMDYVYMWHKYNPCGDDVSFTISRSIGWRSRSHRTFLPKASFSLQGLSLPASVCIAIACACVYCHCLHLCVLPLPASVCVSGVCQSQACLCDNLWPVQVRITKFAPEVQNSLGKVPIVFTGN